jgi:transcriptional regulator with PAS, ATPase and Fis domain
VTRTTLDGAPGLVLELADRHLSSSHAALENRDGSTYLVDRGSKNGTFVNGARIAEVPLADGAVIEVGNTLLLFRDQVERLPREPADADAAALAGEMMATLSPPLARETERASRCAPSDVPILITGPSGTGKEVAARWIHRLSGRRGDLVAINCGALPASLIEAELFGVKRGAYSGADRDRPGLIRAADGGTLFLDEVGELSAAAQVKLLRVLQEKEVLSVGDTRPDRVDIRVLSATLQDVDEEVAGGRFRPDLLARLAGLRFALPALADRREDIGLLTGRLLSTLFGAAAEDLSLERAAGRALLRYDWPLNIRELEQALRSALTLGEGRIGLEHLPAKIAAAGAPAAVGADDASGDEVLRQELIALLRRHGGNISAVAREMDRARVQVRRWCKRFDLDPDSFR